MSGRRPEPPLKRDVRRRAGDRCEYCLIPQAADDRPFELEHTVARKHGGGDDTGNLALACPDCNKAKGPDLCSVDPQTGEVVRLFSPRRQAWGEHFRIAGGRVAGLTAAGRATAAVLRMNQPRQTARRRGTEP